MLCVLLLGSTHAEEHTVNFGSVAASEAVRFISRIAQVNFIADPQLLNFPINFISGKESTPEDLLQTLIYYLKQHDLDVIEEHGHYIIQPALIKKPHAIDNEGTLSPIGLPQVNKQGKFFVYKLQYHKGDEIQSALSQMTNASPTLAQAVQTIHWVQSTNSLVISGSDEEILPICDMIKSLDTPLKQVLIEILVLETSISNSLDFGIKWSGQSRFQDALGISYGTPQPQSEPLLPETSHPFELGIIGDLIFHKGKSFLSLGSLVSALQTEGGTSIVFNQKVIAQENKESNFFVGDTIPFAGSFIKTMGAGQQTTSNVDYKDIGVNVAITPLVGSNDVITLQIQQEITSAIDHKLLTERQVSGIQTTKSQMKTQVHVPDQHYVILSGMSKSYQKEAKAKVPWLASAPLIGSLFRSKETREEKNNILIFVRPQLMHTERLPQAAC